MKVIGFIVVVIALVLMKFSIDAMLSPAHWGERTEEKLSPVIEPLLNSLPSPESKEQQRKAIIDAAYAVSGETTLKLIRFGGITIWMEAVQAVLGITLLLYPNKRNG